MKNKKAKKPSELIKKERKICRIFKNDCKIVYLNREIRADVYQHIAGIDLFSKSEHKNILSYLQAEYKGKQMVIEYYFTEDTDGRCINIREISFPDNDGAFWTCPTDVIYEEACILQIREEKIDGILN